jgi:hypothetical protein
VPDPRDEPTMAVAHGDPALARHLRTSLETLRDRSDNDDFRRLVNDVLHGRADVRDVYATPAFAAGINPGTQQFAERWDQLSREEQEQLVEQGRRQLDEERKRIRREDHPESDDH